MRDDVKTLYNMELFKNKLNEYLVNGYEPEICMRIKENDYMIIPLKDKLSFQWVGNSSEIYYNSFE